MSKATSSSPVIELDLEKYLPRNYDLSRLIMIVENSPDPFLVKEIEESDFSKEDLEWLENELDAIDEELNENKSTEKLILENYRENSKVANIYI